MNKKLLTIYKNCIDLMVEDKLNEFSTKECNAFVKLTDIIENYYAKQGRTIQCKDAYVELINSKQA